MSDETQQHLVSETREEGAVRLEKMNSRENLRSLTGESCQIGTIQMNAQKNNVSLVILCKCTPQLCS